MDYQAKEYHSVAFSTLKDCLDTVCRDHAEHVAYRQILGTGAVEEMRYGVFYRRTCALGARLLSLGLKGAHIAVLGEDSIHWMQSYMAIVCGVGAAVPIDKELDTETMAYQIDFADCAAVFISSRCLSRLEALRPLCPQVRYWIVMRPTADMALPEGCLRLDTLTSEGLTMEEETEQFLHATVRPEDLCDVVFTSGTTGANKGVMLSHRNVTAVIYGSLTHIKVKDGSQSLACLPINHAYEKNCHVLCSFALGYTLCINDDLMHLVPNLRQYRPCNSTMVPMLLETMEKRIKAELKKRGREVQFGRYMRLSDTLRKARIDIRRRLFKPVLSLMGDSLEQIVVGGAPLKDETRRFFDSLGIPIINGYGITECAPLVAANYTFYQRPDSVGRVIPCCQLRIENPDEKGDGLILVRGDNVMMGYYKDPEGTRRVLSEDGWLDTGDLGHLDKDGFLYLTGRLKNLILLSNGKNVSPEELEEILSAKIPYLSEVVVYTDEKGSGIYASVYLDQQYLEEQQITDPYSCFMADLAAINRTLPSYKRIKDVNISDAGFAKTTTQKIQRFKVKKYYQHNSRAGGSADQ